MGGHWKVTTADKLVERVGCIENEDLKWGKVCCTC